MTNQSQADLNPLAIGLNETLAAAAPEVLSMLSRYGERLYFPKGILSQSAEASAKAHRFNATIGIATESGAPMFLSSIQSHLDGLDPGDVYPYAPAAGRPELRRAWREKLLNENPDLQGKAFGLPVATSAITHGLSLLGELFVDEGDCILLPDQLWGNYRLGFEVRLGAKIRTFPFYSDGGFNVAGFSASLREAGEERDKLIVLLNFPNNPTGYMPTPAEADGILSALREEAERGTHLVVVTDDAYFGLFYHIGAPSITQSLFAELTGLHENLLAVKLDGPTKELFVWGLRCGFITFGPGRPDRAEEICNILEAKVKGAIRAGISNVSQLSQSLIEKALASPNVDAERKAKAEILGTRAQRVHEVATQPRFAESWEVYPFNSGYFMCVQLKGADAEQVRLHLLAEHGVGLIATAPRDLRVAFSCLETENVEKLFELLHQAVQEVIGSH